uniref:Uncharacterized protein n=1 Tax=Daphnia magna TaxID=35525 RepID=A0A0P5ZSY3_9CRUS
MDMTFVFLGTWLQVSDCITGRNSDAASDARESYGLLLNIANNPDPSKNNIKIGCSLTERGTKIHWQQRVLKSLLLKESTFCQQISISLCHHHT